MKKRMEEEEDEEEDPYDDDSDDDDEDEEDDDDDDAYDNKGEQWRFASDGGLDEEERRALRGEASGRDGSEGLTHWQMKMMRKREKRAEEFGRDMSEWMGEAEGEGEGMERGEEWREQRVTWLVAELAVSRPAPLVRLLNAQRGWIAMQELEEIVRRLIDRMEPRRAVRVSGEMIRILRMQASVFLRSICPRGCEVEAVSWLSLPTTLCVEGAGQARCVAAVPDASF